MLSDYGLVDEYAGVVKGIIWRLAPQVGVVDLTHAVPPFDVQKGAFILSSAVARLPEAVHLAVVDPGVGTERSALALETAGGDFLVGPDNGLLIPAAERLGGVKRAVSLTNDRFFLQPVCPTFHGRDIFAPAAAHLAQGGDLAELGNPLSPESLAGAPWPPARIYPEEVHSQIIDMDRFGTLRLAVYREDLERGGFPLAQGEALDLEAQAGKVTLPFGRTFAQVGRGELVLLFDSSDRLAIAANMSEASLILGLRTGDTVTLRKVT